MVMKPRPAGRGGDSPRRSLCRLFVDWQSSQHLIYNERYLKELYRNSGFEVLDSSREIYTNPRYVTDKGDAIYLFQDYSTGFLRALAFDGKHTDHAELPFNFETFIEEVRNGTITFSQDEYQDAVGRDTLWLLNSFIVDGRIHIRHEEYVLPPAQLPIAQVRDTYDALISRLVANPADIMQLTPRQFEELCAELLDRDGFRVELTQQTRDGGRDILAYSDTALGSTLFYVECKRYAPNRPVGIAAVQRLHGVVRESANTGAIITSSSFSRDALVWADPRTQFLLLRDGQFLNEWLQKHKPV